METNREWVMICWLSFGWSYFFPFSFSRSPCSVPGSWSSFLVSRSPFSVPRSPFPVPLLRSPFPVPSFPSPLLVLRSPFPVPRSPFSIPRFPSPFSVLRSPFSVLRSPFSVPSSSFCVTRSQFLVFVPRSSFSVPRSPFPLPVPRSSFFVILFFQQRDCLDVETFLSSEKQWKVRTSRCLHVLTEGSGRVKTNDAVSLWFQRQNLFSLQCREHLQVYSAKDGKL